MWSADSVKQHTADLPKACCRWRWKKVSIFCSSNETFEYLMLASLIKPITISLKNKRREESWGLCSNTMSSPLVQYGACSCQSFWYGASMYTCKNWAGLFSLQFTKKCRKLTCMSSVLRWGCSTLMVRNTMILSKAAKLHLLLTTLHRLQSCRYAMF